MSAQKPTSQRDKQAFYASLGFFILTCAVLFFANNRTAAPTPAFDLPTPAQVMTLEPDVAANLTRVPQLPQLTGELAEQVRDLEQQVAACADYGTERRRQMQQHIDWLLTPATLPQEMIIALGANPNGKLVFGMATYTIAEWSLIARNPASCLLPIGSYLNQLLLATGEQVFVEFE
jgi:hypothetical protein